MQFQLIQVWVVPLELSAGYLGIPNPLADVLIPDQIAANEINYQNISNTLI
jgi:hypothetical protein